MELAKFFKHDFDEDMAFCLYDENENEIYYENILGYWEIVKYDRNNNFLYFENSKGFCDGVPYKPKKITVIKEKEKMKKLRLHTETFVDSAHFLKGYDGKCKNLHGHTWRIRVWIEGYPNQVDDVGILFDFGNIKNIKEILDHNCLNDLNQFKEINPTAENITMFIYNHVKKINSKLDFTIRVYETSLGKITYCEYGDFKI